MVVAAPLFYVTVLVFINFALLVISVVLEAWAFVHCLTQRSDAFGAIGTLPKFGWLLILGLALALGILLQGYLLVILIGIGAALLYLLDVRPGLRDVTGGHGSW